MNFMFHSVLSPTSGVLTGIFPSCEGIKIYSYPFTGMDRPLGLQDVQTLRISRQSAHEGGKVVSPTHRPPLPSGKIPGTHFC
jgi:hypothetical protein